MQISLFEYYSVERKFLTIFVLTVFFVVSIFPVLFGSQYILIKGSYRQMDFPKDQAIIKRRLTATNSNYHTKHTPNASIQSVPIHPSKGRVKIQHYQYDQQNLLGQGYTSKVYLGRSVNDSMAQFAIKVVDKRKISRTRENLQLLKQQMLIHKQLDHPNIVKCFEIIEKGSFYYFVLEYCPHGTLDSFIKKHQKLTESSTISIMEQIIAGYKYLIQQKVLHRDLKPPNILKSGNIWKICDFGFSVIGKKNLIGEINVGTPAYMAPESLQRTFYSPKTDFFSLGVMCYEMLCGVTPWQHKNQAILLQMMKEQKIPEEILSSLNNKNLVILLKKCCEANERKRMSLEQFDHFSFWKEQQQQEVEKSHRKQKKQVIERLINKKSGNLMDYASTNHSQTSNNTSVICSTTKSNKKIPIQQLFKGNNAVIERQLYYATVIQHLITNFSYLLFQQPQEKQLFLSLLSKHADYIVRRVKHSKYNYLCLKRWEQYSQSQDYTKLIGDAGSIQLNIRQIMSVQVKRKTIITIRYINKKFDELTYDKNLTRSCVDNLKQYLVNLMDRTAKRYQLLGEAYIKQNKWTGIVLDYLMKYHKFMGQITVGTEESRSIAIKKEYKNRGELLQNFKQSTIDFEEFQSLKNQIAALQN